jgi:hypothetical protein
LRDGVRQSGRILQAEGPVMVANCANESANSNLAA